MGMRVMPKEFITSAHVIINCLETATDGYQLSVIFNEARIVQDLISQEVVGESMPLPIEFVSDFNNLTVRILDKTGTDDVASIKAFKNKWYILLESGLMVKKELALI